MSAVRFLDSTYLIWTYGSRLILSNEQSRVTRRVWDTCLIVGLWWSSLSKLHCLRKCTTVILSQRDVRSKELDLCSIHPHSDPTLWVWFRPWHRFPVCMLGLVWEFLGSFPALQWLNPKSQAQVNRPYANQHPRYDLWFWKAAKHWRLLLAHPTDRYKCSTTKNAQNAAWCWFWVFKISCKVWILK